MLYMLYMETCIRNIKEEDWKYFKSEAVKKNLKLGDFFSTLINEHKKAAKNPWNDILKGKRIFSNKDLDEIKSRCDKFRKEFRFR